MRFSPADSADDSGPPCLDDPAVWDQLIQAVGPPSILVVVDHWLRGSPRGVVADDVWQETLLRAWRARADLEWQDLSAFRHWLLTTARNVVRDIADWEGTLKRGGGTVNVPLGGTGSSGSFYAGPVVSTTPSRVAMDREHAELMAQALLAVPEAAREVVRLRLFEDLTMEEVAHRTGLGVSGARHRFRKGAEAYQHRLRRLLDRSSLAGPPSKSSENGDGRGRDCR